MKHFACLFKLLQFARPYRWRLVMGIAIGFFAGLTNPMLMGSVKLVIDTVFARAGTPTLTEKLQKASAPILAPAEINGATNLLVQLQQEGAGAFPRFLWGQFDAQSKQSLTGTNLDQAAKKALLSAELNRLLQGPSLYTPDRFAGVELSKATRKLLASPPAGTNQIRLNRALLEDAFPQQIAHVGSKSILLQAISRMVSPLLKEIDPRTNKLGTVLAVCTIPLAMLLRGLFTYLNVYLMNWVSIRAISDLRIKLFSHLLTLDAGFFNRVSTGELMSRFTEINYLQNLISSSLVTLIREPITIIGLLFYLLSQQGFLTIVSLAVLPLTLVPFVVYSKKVRKASQGMYAQSSDMGKLLHETFTGYRVVKAYNLEERMVEDFRKTSAVTVSFFMRMLRSMELPGPLIEFFAAVGITSLFIYLAFYDPDRTPGDLLAFAGSIFLMYSPVKNLLRLNTQLEQANAAGQFIFQLLDSRSNVVEPARPKQLKAAGEPIHFDHITFSYGEKQVLQDIELTVPPGRMVALVGSSGSGKTTLANLLLRFYDPQQGAVRIGGTNIRELTTQDLRSQIAVVTQEVILFNDTVRNNILLGRAGATEEEIIAAAKHAYAHEFILQKPEGYSTVIGEKGVALSGGQRQRLAIARAVLKNAPILILDEATSALDTESERAVQAALDKLMQGRTTICIAHRLSTIHHADQIVVMDQGRIVETGRHDELIKRGGVYQKLYEMQFRD